MFVHTYIVYTNVDVLNITIADPSSEGPHGYDLPGSRKNNIYIYIYTYIYDIINV